MVEQGVAHPLPRTSTLRGYVAAPRFADFFSHWRTTDDATILGENQSFCRRWVHGCGGKIWVDGQSKNSHQGEFSFPKNYALSDQNPAQDSAQPAPNPDHSWPPPAQGK